MNIYDRVETIVNKWDPIDLLPLFPSDEYRDEILEILELLKKTHEINEVASGLKEIFIHAFGENVFKSDHEACVRIAKQIVALV